jgi:hypothetical protein
VLHAYVCQHRSGGLRALTAEAHVELTDMLNVAAVLANQNDAFPPLPIVYMIRAYSLEVN